MNFWQYKIPNVENLAEMKEARQQQLSPKPENFKRFGKCSWLISCSWGNFRKLWIAGFFVLLPYQSVQVHFRPSLAQKKCFWAKHHQNTQRCSATTYPLTLIGFFVIENCAWRFLYFRRHPSVSRFVLAGGCARCIVAMTTVLGVHHVRNVGVQLFFDFIFLFTTSAVSLSKRFITHITSRWVTRSPAFDQKFSVTKIQRFSFRRLMSRSTDAHAVALNPCAACQCSETSVSQWGRWRCFSFVGEWANRL